MLEAIYTHVDKNIFLYHLARLCITNKEIDLGLIRAFFLIKRNIPVQKSPKLYTEQCSEEQILANVFDYLINLPEKEEAGTAIRILANRNLRLSGLLSIETDTWCASEKHVEALKQLMKKIGGPQAILKMRALFKTSNPNDSRLDCIIANQDIGSIEDSTPIQRAIYLNFIDEEGVSLEDFFSFKTPNGMADAEFVASCTHIIKTLLDAADKADDTFAHPKDAIRFASKMTDVQFLLFKPEDTITERFLRECSEDHPSSQFKP